MLPCPRSIRTSRQVSRGWPASSMPTPSFSQRCCCHSERSGTDGATAGSSYSGSSASSSAHWSARRHRRSHCSSPRERSRAQGPPRRWPGPSRCSPNPLSTTANGANSSGSGPPWAESLSRWVLFWAGCSSTSAIGERSSCSICPLSSWRSSRSSSTHPRRRHADHEAANRPRPADCPSPRTHHEPDSPSPASSPDCSTSASSVPCSSSPRTSRTFAG